MKYLKKYNSFNESNDTFSGYYDSECLKSRLTSYYREQESEYDPEETTNVLEILDEYNASKHKGININIKEFKHLYHKSNPHFRSDILKNGLIIQKGDSYKLYSPENNELPAIFAYTDDIENYDTTYDDDVYEISLNNKNEWFKDDAARNAIVSYSNIPLSDIKLVYKGTGQTYEKVWADTTEDEEFQKMLDEEEVEKEEQFKKDKRMIRGVMTGCTCTDCDCENCQEEGCTCDCCIPCDTFVCIGCGNICDINNSNSEYSNICHDCEPEEDK